MNLSIAWTLLVIFCKHGLASEVCYDQVGCFTDEEPFRRSYLPESRQIINVTYSLFVRQEPPDEANPYFRTVNVSGPHLQAHETEMESTWKRLLRPTQTTKMIVHDFGDSASNSWVFELAESFLREEPCNVIAVDWNSPNGGIEQAAANGRLVAAEIGLLLEYIRTEDPKLNLSSFHLIAHGLGSHIAALVGRQHKRRDVTCRTDQSGSWWSWWQEEREVTCPEVAGIGRISGLDPTGPWFQTAHDDVRLDRSDAVYVDVIHTDVTVHGISSASGHVDFYPNGGSRQPGCDVTHAQELRGFPDWMNCDHVRSISYYAASFSCPMTSYPCSSWFEFESGSCSSCVEAEASSSGFSLSGVLSYMGVTSRNPERSSCLRMGASPDGPRKKKESVKAFLRTDKTEPFCVSHVRVVLELKEAWSEGSLSFRFTDHQNTRTELIKAGRVSEWDSTSCPSYMLPVPRDFQNISQVTVLWQVAAGTSWFPGVLGSRKGSRKELRLPLTRLKVSELSRQEVNFCSSRRRLRSWKETRFTNCQN